MSSVQKPSSRYRCRSASGVLLISHIVRPPLVLATQAACSQYAARMLPLTGAAALLGLPLEEFMEPTPDFVVDAARRMTGLHDFDSESFREGLEIYMADVAAEERLTDSGLQRIIGQAVMQLANRLQVDDWIRSHPDVLDAPVQAPLFVCGMPRTGTTLAIDLLHADPSRRCLINWEAKKSVPPPEPATFDSDPRLIALREQLAPALAGMKAQGLPIPHWEEADDPTECIFVLAGDFRCLMWGSLIPCPRITSGFSRRMRSPPIDISSGCSRSCRRM